MNTFQRTSAILYYSGVRWCLKFVKRCLNSFFNVSYRPIYQNNICLNSCRINKKMFCKQFSSRINILPDGFQKNDLKGTLLKIRLLNIGVQRLVFQTFGPLRLSSLKKIWPQKTSSQNLGSNKTGSRNTGSPKITPSKIKFPKVDF